MSTEASLRASVLTCPRCGHVMHEEMPTDACLFFHECAGCHALLTPLAGDCCVFCSYGSVKCPPVQAQQACCDSAASPPSAIQEQRAGAA